MNPKLPERRCLTCRYWTRLPLIPRVGTCELAQAYLTMALTPQAVGQQLSMDWSDLSAGNLGAHPTVPTRWGHTTSREGCEHGYEPRTT